MNLIQDAQLWIVAPATIFKRCCDVESGQAHKIGMKLKG